MSLSFPPLFASLDPRLSWRVLPAVAMVFVVLVGASKPMERLHWRTLLLSTTAASAAWATSLAFVDGWGALTRPLTTRYDYLHYLPLVGDPLAFVREYVEDIPQMPFHLKSHPPGVMLLFSALERVGLGGGGPAAVLVIAVGASAAAAVLIAVREVAGEHHARAAAPFVAIAPAAVWIATSADALFAGVSAWGACFVILSTAGLGRRSDTQAVVGGTLLGVALVLSYGMVLVAVVPLAVVVTRRALRPLLIAGGAGLTVLVLFGLAGFWWPLALFEARRAQEAGVFAHRPYVYFLVANLAAFSVAVGPAGVAALARLRCRHVWTLSGAALVAVLIADVSGFSKGEVERIWLPFVPWILVAASALSTRRRRWLAIQASVALLVQLTLVTPW